MTTAADVEIGQSLSAVERRVCSIEAGLLAMEPMRPPAPRARIARQGGSWRIATVLVILGSAALLGPLLL